MQYHLTFHGKLVRIFGANRTYVGKDKTLHTNRKIIVSYYDSYTKKVFNSIMLKLPDEFDSDKVRSLFGKVVTVKYYIRCTKNSKGELYNCAYCISLEPTDEKFAAYCMELGSRDKRKRKRKKVDKNGFVIDSGT